MSASTLETIGLGWRGHLVALHWLGMLYRRPAVVQALWRDMPRAAALRSGLLLLLHAQLYVVVWRLCMFFLLSDHRLNGLDWSPGGGVPLEFLLLLAKDLAVGIAGGIAGGIAVGIAAGIALGIAGGIAGGIPAGIGLGVALGIAVPRAYYLPWHILMIWPAVQGRHYPWHPVAWDDMCGVPFPGLERLLVAYTEHNRNAGQAEIERLIDTYPAQRKPALRARILLIAKALGAEPDLSRLDEIAQRLPAGNDKVLAEISGLKHGIANIAQQQRVLDTAAHAFLREPLSRALLGDIERFRDQAAGLKRPLGPAFRDAATQWLTRAKQQWEQSRAVMDKEPAPQVFRSGNPIDRAKEAFTPRLGIAGELTSQLALATGCPALILYGRRRTGKSTVLRNLDAFLPANTKPAGIDMLSPIATESLALLIGWIAEETDKAIGDGTVSAPEPSLDGLARLLEAAEKRLAAMDKRLLLTIDEIERMDDRIGAGVLPEGLLAVLRHSIQTHRRIIWMFAGSHDIGEMRHAAWASYLINARTIQVPMFTPQETRLLLTEPMRSSPLWNNNEDARPHFEAGFWGDDGIERIQADTGGWPDLVQWVAEAAIDLLNQSAAPRVDGALLERAFVLATERANNTLLELIEKESLLDGEFAYLQGFRTADTQAPPADPAVARSLRRRMLLAESDGQYRMRVPLMRRWLIAKG